MKIYPIILLLVCGVSNNAFCNGGHCGGHGGGHSGGHCGGHSGGYSGHYGGHVHTCYHYHSGGGTGYRNTYWQSDVIPLKGIVETNASVGGGTALQMDPAVTAGSPVYAGSLKYFIGNRVSLDVSIGAQLIAGRDTCHCISSPATATPSSVFDFRTHALTAGIGMTYCYGSHGPWQLYCGAALGLSVLTERDHYLDNTDTSVSNLKFTGQVTLFGLRYGHALGAYAEVGYGYKGLLCAGLSYQAGWRRARRYL